MESGGANGVMIVTTKEGATNEKISVKARLENFEYAIVSS